MGLLAFNSKSKSGGAADCGVQVERTVVFFEELGGCYGEERVFFGGFGVIANVFHSFSNVFCKLIIKQSFSFNNFIDFKEIVFKGFDFLIDFELDESFFHDFLFVVLRRGDFGVVGVKRVGCGVVFGVCLLFGEEGLFWRGSVGNDTFLHGR